METCCQACGECHANHKENSIWRHDAKHVENAMSRMRRIAYGDMMSIKHVENAMQTMRRIAYGEYRKENALEPCGE